MGCTESVPVASEFQTVHKIDPNVPFIGKQDYAPLPNEQTQLVVREKLFSWSGDSFKLKDRNGQSYHNLRIKGKAFALRDRMVLEDATTGKPVAVCLRKFEVIGQTFKIYTTEPTRKGQVPSKQTCNGRALYTYAKVERVPFSTEQQVTMDGKSSPEYTIRRAGAFWPKKRIVKKRGQPAALMEGGTWEGNWNSYLLTVNPGIDPLLIVLLTAVCDEMDEQN